MSKSEDEAYQLLENMAINNRQWPSERETSKKPTGMYEVDVFSNLATQVSLLTKQLQATHFKICNRQLMQFKHALPYVNFATTLI